MTLFGDVVESQMVQLMEHRNRTIMEYMGFNHQDMPEGAFSINNVVIEDMVDYHGKDRYTVTLIVDDEEIELPVEGDDIVEDEEDAFADEQGTNVASEDNLSADTTLNDNVETEK